MLKNKPRKLYNKSRRTKRKLKQKERHKRRKMKRKRRNNWKKRKGKKTIKPRMQILTKWTTLLNNN